MNFNRPLRLVGQKPAGLGLGLKEFLDLLAKDLVCSTGLGKKFLAGLHIRDFHRLGKDGQHSVFGLVHWLVISAGFMFSMGVKPELDRFVRM
jgi:hypothetical protein